MTLSSSIKEKFKDAKGVTKNHTSKTTDNAMAKRKRTNNDLQNTTQKNKD